MKLGRNEYLGMALGFGAAWLLCFILIWSWPPATSVPSSNATHQEYESSPYGHSTQHEISKSLGETFEVIWDRTWDDPVAFYTFMLALLTGLLSVATATTLIIGVYQIRENRREFIATHRPKIMVQSFTISDQGDEKRNALIDFWIANAGESHAFVSGFVIFGYYQSPHSDFHPAFSEPLMRNPKNLHLAPGERVLVRGECESLVSSWNAFHIRGRMFVLGRVEYKGIDQIGRVTGFCREYMSNTADWQAVKDQQYEYSY